MRKLKLIRFFVSETKRNAWFVGKKAMKKKIAELLNANIRNFLVRGGAIAVAVALLLTSVNVPAYAYETVEEVKAEATTEATEQILLKSEEQSTNTNDNIDNTENNQQNSEGILPIDVSENSSNEESIEIQESTENQESDTVTDTEDSKSESEENTTVEQLQNTLDEITSDENVSEEVTNSNDALASTFSQNISVDGVKISIDAGAGVFPEGAYAKAVKVSTADANRVEEAVEEVRHEDRNVAASYTFDITIFDKDGKEIEPDNEKGSVRVSFEMEEVSNVNLDTEVYHVEETDFGLNATELSVEEVAGNEDAVVVETDGFSYYTVEFTYGALKYVLEGDSKVDLNTILETVGIDVNGEITEVRGSNDSLFRPFQEVGVWYVEAVTAFTSKESLYVTIGGTEYEVIVTDATGSWTLLKSAMSGSSVSDYESYFTIDDSDGRKITLKSDITCAAGESGPLTVNSGSTVILDLNGYTIDRALTSAVANGNVITNKGNLTIKDSSIGNAGKITGGKNDGDGGGIIQNGGSLRVEGGSIDDNQAKNKGGGIYISNQVEVNILGDASITNNLTTNPTGSGGGGGIFVYNPSKLTIGGNATISNNISADAGGGIKIYANNATEETISEVRISGSAKIDSNESKYASDGGGGICIQNGGKLYISGNASISNNRAANAGGGLKIYGGFTTLSVSENVKVSGNYAAKGGGGIYVTNADAKFVLTGGSITGNTTDDCGGGIYFNNGSTEISSVNISGNNAVKDGGGVYYKNGTLTMGGNTVVDSNVKGGTKSGDAYIGGTKNNVYLVSGKTITLGTGSNNVPAPTTGMKVGVITATAPTAAKSVQITTGGTGTTAYEENFFSDVSSNSVYLGSGANLYFGIPSITISKVKESGSVEIADPVYAAPVDEDFFNVIATNFKSSIQLKLEWKDSTGNWTETTPGGITASLKNKLIHIKTTATTNSGAYELRVTNSKADEAADFVCGTATLNIKKAPGSITDISAISKVYDGNPVLIPTVTRSGDGAITCQYKVKDADDTTYTSEAPRNAGDYTVKVTVAEGTNYNSVSQTKNFAISKADCIVTAPTGKTGLIYTGVNQDLLETLGSAEGGTIQYSDAEDGAYSGTMPLGMNAGDYEVWYKVTGDDNHNDVNPVKISVKIDEAECEFTAPSPLTIIYDGTEKNLVSAGVTTHGTFWYSLTGNESDFTTSVPKATAKGDYTVYYKIVGDRNHKDVSVKTVQASIGKTTRSGITVSMGNYTYGQSSPLPVPVTNPARDDLPEIPTIQYFYNETGNNAGGTEWTSSIASTDLDAGTYYMYALIKPTDSYQEFTTPITQFTVSKTTEYEVTAPLGKLTYGQTLSQAMLAGGSASKQGDFAWDASVKNVKPNVSASGVTEYDMVFTPSGDDALNYAPKICKAKVDVTPKTATPTITNLRIDGSGNVTEELVGEIDDPLVYDRDYTRVVVSNPGTVSTDYIIDYTFKDNYTGTMQKKVSVPNGQKEDDNIISTVEKDPEAEEKYSPEIQPISYDDSKKVINEDIRKLSEKQADAQKEKAQAIVDKINAGEENDIVYDAELSVEMKALDDVSEEDEESIKKEAENIPGVNEDVRYIDISVYLTYKVQIGTQASTQVVKAKEQIHDLGSTSETITIEVPAELSVVPAGYERTYYVIRAHKNNDGGIDTTLLASSKTKKITFSSSKFSTYALLYADTKINTPTPSDRPIEEPGGMGWFWGFLRNSKKSELEENTGNEESSGEIVVMPVAYAAAPTVVTPITTPGFKSPKTGDSKEVYVFVGLLIIGVAVFLSGRKKKTH